MIPIDRPLIVTDTETTGLNPLRNRLIEIGALRLFDGEEPISFSRLIDPGLSIPYRITRLTGISSAMVFGCPDASSVMPEFEDFLGDGLIVAHNLAFDRGFIDAERERLGLPRIRNDGICTARLARRLLPGLRSKSLDSLSRFFRIAANGRHRALRDVEITAQVLERLMAIAAREHGVDSLDELIEMQGRTYARIHSFSRHILKIRRDVLPDLPDTPGVYRMTDGGGRVLYVGKAKDLSSRVRSYFNAIEAHTPRIRELVSKLRSVEWTPTATELEALLLESRLIQRLDPPFNRAQKRTTPRPYLRIAAAEPFPRVVANVFPRDDGAEYYGPLRSRGEARAVLEVIERFFPVRTCDERELAGGRRCLRADIGRCLAPCEGAVEQAAYSDVLDGVRAFLAGNVAEIVTSLADDMQIASAELAFEEAARLRDLIGVIEGRTERHGAVAPRIFEDDAAILHQDPERDAQDVLIVRAGRFAASVTGFTPDDAVSMARLDEALSATFGGETANAADALRTGANEIRVLLHWLYANRDAVVRVERGCERDLTAFRDAINGQARVFFAGADAVQGEAGPDGAGGDDHPPRTVRRADS